MQKFPTKQKDTINAIFSAQQLVDVNISFLSFTLEHRVMYKGIMSALGIKSYLILTGVLLTKKHLNEMKGTSFHLLYLKYL